MSSPCTQHRNGDLGAPPVLAFLLYHLVSHFAIVDFLVFFLLVRRDVFDIHSAVYMTSRDDQDEPIMLGREAATRRQQPMVARVKSRRHAALCLWNMQD